MKESKTVDEPCTGIIVNASGKPIKHMLYPKILHRDGDSLKLLYGDPNRNRPSLDVDIAAGWTQTLGQAEEYYAVKGDPFIVPATNVTKSGDIIISAEDAAKIEAFEHKYHVLAQARVVIVGQMQ